jgi:hypothetical protein
MTILLQGQKKSSGWGSIGAGLGKGLGEGMEIAQERREAEKQKKEVEEVIKKENAAAKALGLDLEGIHDPKMRQEAFKQFIGLKNAPEMFKSKYDARMGAINSSPIGKYLSNGQEQQPNEQQNQPNAQRQDRMNDQGEIEVGNVKVPSMIPEKAIFQAEAAGEHGIAQQFREHNKQIIDQDKNRSKEVTESYKENKEFINNTYDKYEDSLRRESILDRMDQLDESGELSESGVINGLKALGLSEDWIKNPANQEYTKLSLDLLGGGSLQADYGSRVLQSEFKVSQQRIPTLSQTKEGRKQISQNIKAMLLPAKLKEERLQYYLDKQKIDGKPLPHNLRGQILKDIKPQLEEAYDKFKQRNGRYEVKKGTFPDDNAVEKYFYMADGNEEKAIKMMKEDGYDVQPKQSNGISGGASRSRSR